MKSAEGKERLNRKIEKYRPKIICFVGKGVYQEYIGRKKVNWGLQEIPVIAGVSEFVAPSSSGLVRMKLHEVVAIYKQLAKLKMIK